MVTKRTFNQHYNAYHHHTEAIVVRSEPSGEANKRIWLFTREFGLVIAMVQGVRKPAAKLQSNITDYSVIAADLIRGKNTWRLISSKVIAVPLHGKERSNWHVPTCERSFSSNGSWWEKGYTMIVRSHSYFWNHVTAWNI